jgi:hypothetical protein
MRKRAQEKQKIIFSAFLLRGKKKGNKRKNKERSVRAGSINRRSERSKEYLRSMYDKSPLTTSSVISPYVTVSVTAKGGSH